MTRNRAAAERAGRLAETRAAWLLRIKGYRVLDRRFRGPGGEIDLIARRGRVVAFVEVKHRPTLDQAAESISATARRRISDAARAWLARHPAFAEAELRFDVILSAPGRWPRHLIHAFDAAREP